MDVAAYMYVSAMNPPRQQRAEREAFAAEAKAKAKANAKTSASVSVTPTDSSAEPPVVKTKKSFFRKRPSTSSGSTSTSGSAPLQKQQAPSATDWPGLWTQSPKPSPPPSTSRSTAAPAPESNLTSGGSWTTRPLATRTISADLDMLDRSVTMRSVSSIGSSSANSTKTAPAPDWPGLWTQTPRRPKAKKSASSLGLVTSTKSSPRPPPPVPPKTSFFTFGGGTAGQAAGRSAYTRKGPPSVSRVDTSTTPRSSASVIVQTPQDTAKGLAEDTSRIAGEQADAWWDVTPRPPTLPFGSTPADYAYDPADTCPDDSPTLPPLTLPDLSPILPTLPAKQRKASRDGGLCLGGMDDEDLFNALGIDDIITQRRPSDCNSDCSSRRSHSYSGSTHSADSSYIPYIPSRSTSRRPPFPSRGSSMGTRSYSSPIPTTSLPLTRKRCSSTSRSLASTLQPISETPRDLDLIPTGSWALRPRPRPRRLRPSTSEPNLRTTSTMNFKLRVSRSNSQSQPGAFVSRDAFPAPAPTSPNRGDPQSFARDKTIIARRSFDDRSHTYTHAHSQSSFLSTKKGRRRPSLLGLPDNWSPKPKPKPALGARSASDSMVPTNPIPLSLSFPSLSRVSSESKTTMEPVLRRKHRDETIEALEAISDAEKWTWPAPPYRLLSTSPATPPHTVPMTIEIDLPLLSTSETLESVSLSPQTPDSAEFCLHGEEEYQKRVLRRFKGTSVDSGSGGGSSLEIVL